MRWIGPLQKKEGVDIPGLSGNVCVAELVPDEVLAPFEVRIQHLVQPFNFVAVPTRVCVCTSQEGSVYIGTRKEV